MFALDDIKTLTVSVTDAARTIGVSRSTIYRWAQDDPTFPVIRRFGKRVSRIVLDDLTRWVGTRPTLAEAERAERAKQKRPIDNKRGAPKVASS